MTQSKYQLLLIEDNPDHAILINGILTQHRKIKKICIVKNGQEAVNFIEKAKQNKELPDLILLDLKLPRLDGFELLRIWKKDEIVQKIPTVVLTTSDIDKDREAAMALGADQYLVKPSNFNRFSDKINALIKEFVEHNVNVD